MTSNEIEKWADSAMFKAESIDASAVDKPRAYLIWMTPDPLGAAAALNSMYIGAVKRSLSDVTRAERAVLLEDMGLTALKTPLEAIKLHILFEGVTRAFTHQLVRNRTSAYAQESMRFAVVGQDADIPVSLPPSLAGTMSEDDIDVDVDEMSKEQRQRLVWDDARIRIQNAYRRLVDTGMPAEDARGLLPTNIKTRINMVTDLRTLIDIAGVRLCTQAQFEWRSVFTDLAAAIHDYAPHGATIEAMTQPSRVYDPILTDALRHMDLMDAWQFQAIAKVFRPICYNTGKCEFKATADRSCTIRNRVDANAALGRPSSEWHRDLLTPPEDGPFLGRMDNIEAINPVEWMLDPTAAR